MDETPNRPSAGNTTKAVKDKNCPYCLQAFTSSSLGRHLDLYIRDKNPKPPDGVHDVEAIRNLRQNITRRQPKGRVARRTASSSAGTPTAAAADAEAPSAKSPLSETGGPPAPRTSSFPFKPRWEFSGVIDDLATPEGGASRTAEENEAGRQPPRCADRQSLKQQLDLRQQLQDAQDMSKAAELALRELLGSVRAAKQQIDTGSAPFDFDPLSLDFPALILQCLEPPSTLFASTQHPTPTSWSILPPGQGQYQALRAYFEGEFRRWKVACTVATTAVAEELLYPPPVNIARVDTKAEVRRAEKAAEKMEKRVYDHLEATYSIWIELPPEQREQLWRLELARGVGRKQQEVCRLKEAQHLLRQENVNLKTQIDQLARLQQPREFNIAPPSTVYVDEKLLDLLGKGIVSGRPYVGFNIADRHSDLNSVVSTVIGRWKNVIASTRSAGSRLQAQRPLNAGSAGELSPGSTGASPFTNQQQNPQQAQQPDQGLPRHRKYSQRQYPPTTGHPASALLTSAAASITPQMPATSAAPNTAPFTNTHGGEDTDEDEEMSDQDADDNPTPGRGPDGDADGDTDADADADMYDDSGDYTNSLQQQHSTDSVIPMGTEQMGQLEAAQARAAMNLETKSTAGRGITGYGNAGQRQGHVRRSWA